MESEKSFDLKPCPFCGGEADFETQLDETGLLWTYAVCQQCFAQTDGCESEEHAAICWNMRRVEDGK